MLCDTIGAAFNKIFIPIHLGISYKIINYILETASVNVIKTSKDSIKAISSIIVDISKILI